MFPDTMRASRRESEPAMTTTRTRARAVAQEAANEEITDAAVASHPLEDDVMEEVEAPVDAVDALLACTPARQVRMLP